jgi:DNA replication protein DnaC
MSTKEDIAKCCKQLRLSQNIVENLDSIENEVPEEFLLELFQREILYRDEVRKTRSIKNAGFYKIKTFEGFQFENITLPGDLNPEELKSCKFIEDKKNLILYGNVGTGKTHLATAVGVEACNQGYKVLFYRTSTLVNKLLRAKKEGVLVRFIEKLNKADLIICDEWGYVPIDRDGSRLLFQVVSDCYERISMVITTNIEFSRWGTIFYDEQMTTAMIDRLVHYCHLLIFDGESWRMKNSLIRQ